MQKKGLECMERITADEVFDAMKKLVSTRRAVFFDRDGTLCRDAHYLKQHGGLEIFPSVSSLKGSGIKAQPDRLVNQSGIARGMGRGVAEKSNQNSSTNTGFEDFTTAPPS